MANGLIKKRRSDIFLEFLIYIPLENCVTDFSLYIHAAGVYQKQAIMSVSFVKYIPCTYRYFLLKPPPY